MWGPGGRFRCRERAALDCGEASPTPISCNELNAFSASERPLTYVFNRTHKLQNFSFVALAF